MSSFPENIISIVAGTGNMCQEIIIGLLKRNATVIAPVKSYGEMKWLKETTASILTGELVVLLTDVPDYDRATSILEDIEERFGRIDLTIMVFDNDYPAGQLTEVKYTAWEKMQTESISACFIAGKVILHAMKCKTHGTYIVVSGTPSQNAKNMSPLTSIAWNIQAEISRIFAAEVKNSNVKYYHAFINNRTSQEHGTDVTGHIIKLCKGEVKYPNNLFQIIPG